VLNKVEWLNRTAPGIVLKSACLLSKNINMQKWGRDADVVIKPNLGHIYSKNPTFIGYWDRLDYISAGAIATWEKIPLIKALLDNLKKSVVMAGVAHREVEAPMDIEQYLMDQNEGLLIPS
jgi:hypothetical protein